MNKQPSRSELPQTPDPQQISKWARAYAQNRSLGVVIFLTIILVLCVVKKVSKSQDTHNFYGCNSETSDIVSQVEDL